MTSVARGPESDKNVIYLVLNERYILRIPVLYYSIRKLMNNDAHFRLTHRLRRIYIINARTDM